MRLADAWRPDLDRWTSTPWEKPVRAVFRDHRMSRPARPASTWANLCFPPCGAASATLVGGGHGSNHRTRRRARRAPGLVLTCAIVSAVGRRASRKTRTFGAMRCDLAALGDWLREMSVTHVGMEATGVYWQPVHAALENAFTVVIGNASHMRNAPGCKTDVKGRWQGFRPRVDTRVAVTGSCL